MGSAFTNIERFPIWGTGHHHNSLYLLLRDTDPATALVEPNSTAMAARKQCTRNVPFGSSINLTVAHNLATSALSGMFGPGGWGPEILINNKLWLAGYFVRGC